MNRPARIASLGLALTLFGLPALAADDAEQQDTKFIEEVIVTAEKREENLLDVPVTMTAFSTGWMREFRNAMIVEATCAGTGPCLRIASITGRALPRLPSRYGHR